MTTTATVKRLPDPDDDSIENSLRRLESKLRWWSPLLLGWFKTFTPYVYQSAIGFSTILGYVLFFLPSAFFATLITDIATQEPLFTTATTAITTISAVPLLIANTLALSIVGLGLYAVLLVNYKASEPNTSDNTAPFSWQKMKKSSLICTPLFGLVVGVYVLNPTNLLFTSSLVLSWWVARKTSKAIVRDYKYHLSEGPYTTHLIATRVPFGAALLSALLGYSIVSLALATLPFIMSGYYLYWRDINNVSDGDDLRKQRVRESERLPEHILDSYSKQGMHTAYANERLLRESLRKFNSFLDTEIDTQKRITIPDDAFTQSDLSRIRTEVNSIYEDFNGVAYRPQRFADIKNQIEKYSSQLQDVMNEENLKNN